MSDLTILVTESPRLAGIPAALRDWSAAGLIRTFAWVPPPLTGARGFEARLIDRGDVVVSSIGDLLARRSPSHVRVVSLATDLTPAPESSQAAQDILGMIKGAGGEIRTTQMQLVVTRLGAREGRLRGMEGWHNILISPDDAAGPSRPHTTLDGPVSAEDMARFALPTVAIVAALFDGVDAGPFDNVTPPPGAEFLVLRAFARHLDAGAVRDALQAQALGLADGYPLVLDGGTTPATYVENVDRASLDMARALWHRHSDVLMSARRSPQLAPVEDLSIWKAFRMLWSFLWAAIVNAPTEWANRILYTGKVWVASTATRAIFGNNSAFAVVVGGVRGGSSSSWESQVHALGALENTLGPADEGHQVHARLDSLWQDFVAGGLTLLDGSTRRPDMEAARIGSETGIIRFGRLLAPSKTSDSFTDIPGVVRAVTETDSLAPYDTLSIRRFGGRLNDLAADPMSGADASACLARFQEWWRGISTTYTTKTALRLSDEFERRLVEIAENTKILEAAQSTSGLPEEIGREQKRLARRLRWLLIALLLLIIGTVALGVLAIIGWLIAGIALAVWVIGWLVGSVITFARVQRRLFQLKNLRAEALSKADAAEYNLAAAIRDARRCGDAYRLLQQWAEALAVFARDPLGRASTEAVQGAGPGVDHPLAIQFGRAEVNDREIARIASVIRRQVFPVGWLSDVWDAFLGSAGQILGVRGTVLLDEPGLLYRQRAVQEDVLLPMWIGALVKSGVPDVAGVQLWDRIVTSLQTTARAQLEQLLGQVRTESGEIVPLSVFLGGLTSDVASPTGFPTALFSAPAVTRDLPRPVRTWRDERAEGLSRTVVLIQASDVMPAEFLHPESAPYGSRGLPQQGQVSGPESEAPSGPPRMPDPSPISNQTF